MDKLSMVSYNLQRIALSTQRKFILKSGASSYIEIILPENNHHDKGHLCHFVP